MSHICQVTGSRPGFGNRISHSHRRTIDTVVADPLARGEQL